MLALDGSHGPAAALPHRPIMNASVPSWTAPPPDSAGGVYARAIRRHWLVIALVTAAALGAGIALISLRSPEYEATAQVLVAPLSADAQTFVGLPLLRDTGSDPSRVLETAATLLRSPTAAGRTARRMGPGWDARRVLDSIDVAPQGQSNIVEIVGKAERPRDAARLANTFTESALRARADALLRQVDATLVSLRARQKSLERTDVAATAALAARISELEAVREGGDPTLSLARTASLPTSRAGAPAPIVLILCLIAGLTLGIAAALLLEMLNRRVRDEDEAIELYDLPVLSRVPLFPSRYRRQAGDGTTAVMPPSIQEAFRTVLAQLTTRSHKGTRSIMVTSASTGDGKTTSAVGIAIALATARYQVLLLDLDLRKPGVAQALGVKAQPLTALLTADPKNFGDLFHEVPDIPTLSVLATARGWGESDAAADPADALPLSDGTDGRDIGLLEMLHERVPLLLAEARAAADYVVIDTPPLGEFSDALRIANEVDDVIVVTRPRHTNRRSFEVMRDLLDRTGNVPAGMLVIGGSPAARSQYYQRPRATGSGRRRVSVRR